MKKIVLLLLISLNIAACEGKKVDYTYPKAGPELKRQQIGSIINNDSGGGLSLLGNNNKSKEAPAVGVGHSLLWKAALETISFMPLQQSDAVGGVIITDWYANPATPKERFKMNIMISSAELKVDALKVTVFRETMDNKGNWSSATVNPKVALDLEDKIINKAKSFKIEKHLSS